MRLFVQFSENTIEYSVILNIFSIAFSGEIGHWWPGPRHEKYWFDYITIEAIGYPQKSFNNCQGSTMHHIPVIKTMAKWGRWDRIWAPSSAARTFDDMTARWSGAVMAVRCTNNPFTEDAWPTSLDTRSPGNGLWPGIHIWFSNLGPQCSAARCTKWWRSELLWKKHNWNEARRNNIRTRSEQINYRSAFNFIPPTKQRDTETQKVDTKQAARCRGSQKSTDGTRDQSYKYGWSTLDHGNIKIPIYPLWSLWSGWNNDNNGFVGWNYAICSQFPSIIFPAVNVSS